MTDRVPRTPSVRDPDDPAGRDPLGRMALYSSVEPEPEAPSRSLVTLECSSCLKRTAVGPTDLVKAALPVSIHLPFVKRYHSYMRCPSCGKRAWLRVVPSD